MERNGHFIIIQYKDKDGKNVKVPICEVEKIHFFKDGTYFVFTKNGNVYEFDNRSESIVFTKF